MDAKVEHDLRQLVSMGYISYKYAHPYVRIIILSLHRNVDVPLHKINDWLNGFRAGIDAQRAMQNINKKAQAKDNIKIEL